MKYKLLNTTFKLNKRDENYNKTLYFDYVDGFEKKTITIRPSQLIYIEFKNLPISLHRLRMQGLVSVLQVTDDEFNREYDKHKKILINDLSNKEIENNNKTSKPLKTYKKKENTKATTYSKRKTNSKRKTSSLKKEDIEKNTLLNTNNEN